MSKKNCDLVRDLLPLYTENLCSEESRQTVAAHLAECSECAAQLNKMNQDIRVKADDDIAVMRRIKRRIRIEKIIIALVVIAALLIAMYFLFFWLLNTDTEMDYNRYGLEDLVSVELDDNGDLWLVRDGFAMTAESVYPTLSDTDGNHFGYDQGFDKEKKCGFGYTLRQRRVDSIAYVDMSLGNPERSLICNINEQTDVQYVFYYEAKTNTEHVLWERS